MLFRSVKALKLKLLRSNPLRKLLILNGSNPNTTIDDEDLYPVVYQRTRFDTLKKQIDDMDISDEIKLRLMLIRVKALQKHQEVYYNSDT